VRAGLTPDPLTGFGVVTAVGGPPGAGTTEVAIGLAQRLAHRRLRVVLVDCNEADAGLGVRLGLAPDGGVVAAAEAVRLDERPVEACFARRLDGRPLPFEVISGMADVKTGSPDPPVAALKRFVSATRRRGLRGGVAG
jgi:Mrp family chromosome partitioning ATPase